MSTKTYSDDLFTRRYKTNVGYDSKGNINNGPNTTLSSISVTDTGSRTGVPNPLYRAQIRQGQCATTTLVASRKRSHVITGTFLARTSLKDKSGRSEYYGIWCPGYPNPTTTLLDASKTDNQALMKFYKKARAAQRRCQGGVIIGELLETIHMVRNAAKNGRKIFDHFTRDVYRKARRPVGALSRRKPGTGLNRPVKRPKSLDHIIADSWLEFALGWVPTVNDVKDGSEALARIHERARREFVPVTAFSENRDQIYLAPSLITIPGSPVSFTSITTKERTVKVKYYGRVRVALDNVFFEDAVTLGLSVSDVLPTAWNLLPWTFLLDYFTNIGDVIEALSFPKADIAWLTRTQRRTSYQRVVYSLNWERTAELVSVDAQLDDLTAGAMSAYSERSDVDRRQVVPSVPSLQFELPFSSVWKDLNIAGLLVTRGRPPRTR